MRLRLSGAKMYLTLASNRTREMKRLNVKICNIVTVITSRSESAAEWDHGLVVFVGQVVARVRLDMGRQIFRDDALPPDLCDGPCAHQPHYHRELVVQ